MWDQVPYVIALSYVLSPPIPLATTVQPTTDHTGHTVLLSPTKYIGQCYK